ncbi:MAG TPA: DUF1634 domain-containing protein [Candidatus Obscuribacterales bacterium]
MSHHPHLTTSPMDPESEKLLDVLISNVLRGGLIVASSLMIVGGIIYFWHATTAPTEYSHFVLEPTQLRTLSGILTLAFKGDGEGIMQLAVVVLLATPFLRVVASLLMFLREKDWKYVVVSLVVLSVLLYSLFAGQTGG